MPEAATKPVLENTKQDKSGGETRTSFMLDTELLEDFKAMAYWKRKPIKRILQKAMAAELESFTELKKARKYYANRDDD